MSPEFTYRKQCLRNLIRNSPSSSPSSLYYWCWRETYNATRRCLLSHGTLVRLSLMLTPCNINRSENGGERIRPYTTVAAAQCNSDGTESVCTSESKQQQLCIDTHIVHSGVHWLHVCSGPSDMRWHRKSCAHSYKIVWAHRANAWLLCWCWATNCSCENVFDGISSGSPRARKMLWNLHNKKTFLRKQLFRLNNTA